MNSEQLEERVGGAMVGDGGVVMAREWQSASVTTREGAGAD